MNTNQFIIQFFTGNADFADDYEGEVEKVLNQVIKQVKQGRTDGILKDTNGNNVGNWSST